MGCSGSRSDITAEEATVINSEHVLGYSELEVTQIDLIHRKYSYAGKILEDQWKDIYISLDLAPNKAYTKQQVINFFDNFKSGPNIFSLKKLLILGILLGNGTIDKKAQLLFETQDVEGTGVLTEEQLRELIKLLIEIPVEINTRIKTLDEVNNVNEGDLRNYVIKLRKGKKIAEESIVHALLEDKKTID